MDFTTASGKIYITSTTSISNGSIAIIMPVMTTGTLPGMEDEEENE